MSEEKNVSNNKRYYPKFHFAGVEDMFPRHLDYSFIKGDGNVARQYAAGSKRDLAVQIFHTFMQKIIEDILYNNDAFEFPAYSACLMVEGFPKETFEKYRQEGKLKHFNALFMSGDGYRWVYRFKKFGHCSKRLVTLNKDYWNEFVHQVNMGKRYFQFVSRW